MYLFSRNYKAQAGKAVEAATAAVTIADKGSTITGHPIYVWRTAFGAPIGTLSWSMRLESQAQLIELGEKLEADPTFVEMQLGLAESFEGDMVDRLVSVVSGTPAPTPPTYIATVEASMAEGKYAEAIAFGVSMQEFIASELGLTTMFGAETYGGFASVVWLTGAQTAADLDRLNEFQMTNADYHERVNSAAGLFVESSGQQGLIEKIN
jgi:hypothetical protein